MISVVRERKLRLLHQVVVRLIDIGRGTVRITHRQMNTRQIRWRRAGRNGERRHKVCGKRVSVWPTVVRVLIVNLVLEDRDSALLAGEEVHIGCDDVGLVSASNRGIVMKPRSGTVYVEPRANDVDWLSKVQCDTCISRSIDTVIARIATEYRRTNLHDGCGAPWIGNARNEVVLIVVVICASAVFSEDRCGITGRRCICRLCAISTCTVSNKIYNVHITQWTRTFERVEVIHQRDLASRGAHIDVADDVGCRQRPSGSATRGKCD